MSEAVERQEEVNRRMAQLFERERYRVVGGTEWTTIKVRDLSDDLTALIDAKLIDLPYRVVNWDGRAKT